ncbi:hypothetical protein [Streptomyces sp. NPDC054849]
MTEPSGPIGAALPAQAEREQPVCKFPQGCHRVVACNPGCGAPIPAAEQPGRHTVDTITDDALDQLYARLDAIESGMPQPLLKYVQQVNDIEAQRAQLPDEERQRREAADAPLLRIQLLHLLARADRAEAAIARVRETAACWERMPSDRHVYIHEAARALRVALDEPKEPRP